MNQLTVAGLTICSLILWFGALGMIISKVSRLAKKTEDIGDYVACAVLGYLFLNGIALIILGMFIK